LPALSQFAGLNSHKYFTLFPRGDRTLHKGPLMQHCGRHDEDFPNPGPHNVNV
jgi:hypothetical protein